MNKQERQVWRSGKAYSMGPGELTAAEKAVQKLHQPPEILSKGPSNFSGWGTNQTAVTDPRTVAGKLKFYREDDTGDYLAIEPSTNQYYLTHFGEDSFEGRATAIANNVLSVCTTSMSRRFLDNDCTEVKQSEVPQDWQNAIGI